MREIIKMYKEAHATSLLYLAILTILLANILIYIFLIDYGI